MVKAYYSQQLLPTQNSGSVSTQSTNPVYAIEDQLNSLEYDHFINFLRPIFAKLLAKAERMTFVHTVLLSVLESCKLCEQR